MTSLVQANSDRYPYPHPNSWIPSPHFLSERYDSQIHSVHLITPCIFDIRASHSHLQTFDASAVIFIWNSARCSAPPQRPSSYMNTKFHSYRFPTRAIFNRFGARPAKTHKSTKTIRSISLHLAHIYGRFFTASRGRFKGKRSLFRGKWNRGD